MNQIRKTVQARIDNIIQLSELAGDIVHKPTIGELRETYLIEFFKNLVPHSVSLTSGFVTDAKGAISPQLDLIVTQKAALPLIAMKTELSIVPVESALLVAEIKSLLDTSALKQVKMQNEKLTSLNISGEMGRNNFIVPTVILAYDSNIKLETLKEWMKSNGNTVACCILKKETFLRGRDVEVYENTKYGIKHYGVLKFVATFHGMLKHLLGTRDFQPSLDHYLIGRSADAEETKSD